MNLFLWTDELTDKQLPILSHLKEAGFDGVEVPVFNLKPDIFFRWGRRLDEIGLERTVCTVRGADENPISTDSAIRQKGVAHNKLAVDCCEALGATMMCGPFHSGLGVFTGRGPTEDEWKWGVEGMQELCEHAEKANVTLGIEFLNRFECYFLNCAKDTACFIDAVGHPRCKMLFDTFHAHIEEKNIAAAIRASGPMIGHVHMSENDRGTPGEGQVKWDEVFRALGDIRYNDWLIIEAFGLALPHLAAATKIWRRMYGEEKRLARDGLQFLRSHLN